VTGLVDDLTLSDSEVAELKDNYDAAFASVIELGQFGSEVGSGEVDVSDAVLTAPSAENEWTGSFSYAGADFPNGDGEIAVEFTVLDSNGDPVDPFAVDLSLDDLVTTELVVEFSGTSGIGEPLVVNADFRMVVDRRVADKETVTITGTFDVFHGDYFASFTADQFSMEYDAATNEPLSASGRIDGRIDIPNYPFDCDVEVLGNGDVISILVDVLSNTIEDEDVPVGDFQLVAVPETP
jgi:hypothetical protein